MWIVQGLPDDYILDLVELFLLREWQKALTFQWFDSTTQGLTDIVEFCEPLDTSKEILHTLVEVQHQNKKTSSLVNATNRPVWS